MLLREKKYYHFYATANDDANFYYDLKNFLRLREYKTGVDKIHLLIAISLNRKETLKQRFFLNLIKLFFYKSNGIDLVLVTKKNNLGRDFSSFSKMLRFIGEDLQDEDYIFFQNRSGYGPFADNWYSNFIKQIEVREDIAICGSTINFRDHPTRSDRIDFAHVQTYAFISKGKFQKLILNEFPGVTAKSRLDAIINGEIELSQVFLAKGYGITCMEWPNECIFKDTSPISNEDVRGKVLKDHHFYHRGYFEQDKKFKRSRTEVIKTITNFLFKSILF